MAVLKRNKNQFRKVYPGVRRTPRYENIQSMEVGKLTFTNSDSETFFFTNSYSSSPSIVASVFGTNGAVSVIVTELSQTRVVVKTSAKFTGEVHLHILEASS